MIAGLSDLEYLQEIGRCDAFRIGSVTKSFAVTVILQLAEEGRLRLNDPISAYVPDVQNGSATLVRLADMRSGIFNYAEDAAFVEELIKDLDRPWSAPELVAVADRNPVYICPGEGWH
jgi:CubicO group peptidase (beta-lactamase class C family)